MDQSSWLHLPSPRAPEEAKFRGSLLVVASDALSFKFGKRRPSVRQTSTPVVLPDVIEITAAAREDEEVAERNRLREMAAQSLGLPLTPSQDTHSGQADDSDDDHDHDDDNSEHPTSHLHSPRSPHDSNLSVTTTPLPIQTHPPIPTRLRSGSMATHSPSNSTHILPIPPFPTTVSALNSFKQAAGMHPKYYPPSSLRIFALAKNWKTRYLILSSPATLVTRGEPAVSYLHLFKSSSHDDRELERLEINEDSVVFVAEEEVAGKKLIIKVGGTDVGALRKEFVHEEGGHTMWFLSIANPTEAQRWITEIKNAILGQRTVRAGLIPAHTLGHNEPRGDMDVMLTMRTQGLVSPLPSPRESSQTERNYASSISSQSGRSQTTASKPVTSGAVSALKGLFANSTRPRSTSRATSVDSERQTDINDDTFSSMGNNLLNLLRPNTPQSQSETHSVHTISTSPVIRNSLPYAGPVRPLERKIIPERQSLQWDSSQFINKNRAAKTMSLGSPSLQPPPRKRWTSIGPPFGSNRTSSSSLTDKDHSVYGNISNVGTGTSSVRHSVDSMMTTETEPPASPTAHNGFSFGSPQTKPRAPSLQSVSTYTSDRAISMDRSSSSTRRSSGNRSTRRWSRQGILPQRLTPPAGPPPATPSITPITYTEQSSPQNRPYPPEEHQLSTSSPSPPPSSRGSQRSIVSDLPTFSKRASGSSARSFVSTNSFGGGGSTSGNANSNPIVIRTPLPHRASVPPPRPAPTSALPPAPIPSALVDDNHDQREDILRPLEALSTVSKTGSIRSSVTSTRFRLSMMAPKPPPATTLPPRPDEPEFKSHRRSSSGSGSVHSSSGMYPPSVNGHADLGTGNTKLESIPQSPTPPPPPSVASASTPTPPSQQLHVNSSHHQNIIHDNPFPAPSGPLPPPPAAVTPSALASVDISSPSFPSLAIPPTTTSLPPSTLPPSSATSTHATISRDMPVKRATSLKQRLRMLSAPSPNSSSSPSLSNSRLHLGRLSNPTPPKALPPPSFPPPALPLPLPNGSGAAIMMGRSLSSPPSTPIAEKITLFQNDPSFLQMHTPTIEAPVPRFLVGGPSGSSHASLSLSGEGHGLTSLSPPPRRGSKQLVENELGVNSAASGVVVTSPTSPVAGESLFAGDVHEITGVAAAVAAANPGGGFGGLPPLVEGRRFSLSRAGSLGSVKSASSGQLLGSDVESLRTKSPVIGNRNNMIYEEEEDDGEEGELMRDEVEDDENDEDIQVVPAPRVYTSPSLSPLKGSANHTTQDSSIDSSTLDTTTDSAVSGTTEDSEGVQEVAAPYSPKRPLSDGSIVSFGAVLAAEDRLLDLAKA